MLDALRRGLTAGAVGGLLAGAFGFLLAEPLMDHAVDLEAARARAAGDVGVEAFTRNTQHAGLLLATLLVGLALGVLYAVVHSLLHRDDTADAWGRALRLGGAAFFALGVVPFLRYPSNPPGVGEAETIDSRAHLWTVSLVIGLVGACLAALVARGLRERGVPSSLRQLAVTGVLAATVALTFVLPDDTDPIEAPVHLIWDFRLLSFATTVLLWGGLAATFGLLGERASRRTG
ncbi:MAG TPA: CbtA family protein [Mycobacteriales bacterium]|nr:CbtA family protein [Mycobacteriales bacterium]